MRPYWLILLAAGVVLAADPQPKTPPDKQPDKAAADKQAEALRELLTTRERQMWGAWKARDTAGVRDLMAEGYEEVGRPGSPGRLSKSDRDAPEGFHDLFDLPRALSEGFELTLDDRSGVKRGDR